jgi:Cu+-exporting ATPase
MEAAVDHAGYRLIVPGADQSEDEARDRLEAERRAEYVDLKQRTTFALTAAVFLMVGMWWQTVPALAWIPERVMHPLFFAVATPVQFWAGWRFIGPAWKAARHGASDMNTLVVLGTLAASMLPRRSSGSCCWDGCWRRARRARPRRRSVR